MTRRLRAALRDSAGKAMVVGAALALAAAGLAGGCTPAQGPVFTGKNEMIDEEILTRASVGQGVTIRLPVQDGTGYGWRLMWGVAPGDVMSLFRETRETPEPSKDGKPVVGGQSWQVYSLKAERPGEGKVVFYYERPWERVQEPARKYVVWVRVEK